MLTILDRMKDDCQTFDAPIIGALRLPATDNALAVLFQSLENMDSRSSAEIPTAQLHLSCIVHWLHSTRLMKWAAGSTLLSRFLRGMMGLRGFRPLITFASTTIQLMVDGLQPESPLFIMRLRH
jgi:hypothetical protein